MTNSNLVNKLGWTDWTAWSSCSQSCDPGVEERTRDCLDPKTSTVVAGENCSLVAVIDSLQRPCNLIDCIREGEARNMGLLIKTSANASCVGWGFWGPWSDCDKRCDTGQRGRSRQCYDSSLNPAAASVCGGAPADETESCNTFPCQGRHLFLKIFR